MDGVLTDNGIYLGPVDGQPVELKRFDIQDGLGHVLHADRGHPGGLGERPPLRGHDGAGARAPRRGGAAGAAARRSSRRSAALLERRGIAWEEAAFVGDDLADLQVLRRVGLPVAVANAVAEVKAVAAYVDPGPRADTARCARSSRRCSRRGESGPSCSSATSRSRRDPCRLTTPALVGAGAPGAGARGRGDPARRRRASTSGFARAVRLLADASGRVIVSGVGKSGLIARKLAATLTSTGTAATYLHPVDSLHGDLGIVGRSDVAIVLSKSGESEELFGLVGSLQRLGVPIIAITGAHGFHAGAGGRRWRSTAASRRRPARTTSRRPRAPPWRSRWATRSPSRCSR